MLMTYDYILSSSISKYVAVYASFVIKVIYLHGSASACSQFSCIRQKVINLIPFFTGILAPCFMGLPKGQDQCRWGASQLCHTGGLTYYCFDIPLVSGFSVVTTPNFHIYSTHSTTLFRSIGIHTSSYKSLTATVLNHLDQTSVFITLATFLPWTTLFSTSFSHFPLL